MTIYEIHCSECCKPLALIALVQKLDNHYGIFLCMECGEKSIDDRLDEMNIDKKFQEIIKNTWH